jgi:uncharacterized phiE125 gp8 family phage protein
MALTLVTAPAQEPISLVEAKAHLRVDTADDDALIDGLIRAAREHVETYTHRAPITQTWDLKRNEFPCGDVIWIPKAPLVSVTSITYVDTAGDSQTWSSALYTVDAPSGPMARQGLVTPVYGESFPSTRRQVNAVTVRFVAGYGSTTAASLLAVPASIKAAMKILIAHWYGPGRTSVNVGNIVTVIPSTVDALLWPYKSFEYE